MDMPLRNTKRTLAMAGLEENTDVKAFTRHHPTGQFGFNYFRQLKLSPSLYFGQRMMNEDERFSRDPFYVFYAAAFIGKRTFYFKMSPIDAAYWNP